MPTFAQLEKLQVMIHELLVLFPIASHVNVKEHGKCEKCSHECHVDRPSRGTSISNYLNGPEHEKAIVTESD